LREEDRWLSGIGVYISEVHARARGHGLTVIRWGFLFIKVEVNDSFLVPEVNRGWFSSGSVKIVNGHAPTVKTRMARTPIS
jgi:hypothetical protein